MSEPIHMAKSAREHLARALAALQTDSTLPAELIAVAEPVSQAMGALFRIERSEAAELGQAAPLALDAVRRSLAMLQGQPSQHQAVDISMEAVAGALGLVHGLNRLVQAPAPSPQPHPPSAPPAPAPSPQPQPIASPTPQAQPIASPAPVPQAIPQAQPVAAPREAVRIPPDIPKVEVGLAAHSASNFYQGLGQGDIVQNGGVFVATYSLLKIGDLVALRVLFPGGYEADIHGRVRWTREPRQSTIDAAAGVEPGYGVEILDISSEGRALIARYVRNREPLFYDDL